MNFHDLLKTDSVFSCELITNSCETGFSFEWNKTEQDLTQDGINQFKKILNSQFKFIENGDILLLDDNITYDELNLFLGGLAGYISITVYNKWFKVLE